MSPDRAAGFLSVGLALTLAVVLLGGFLNCDLTGLWPANGHPAERFLDRSDNRVLQQYDHLHQEMQVALGEIGKAAIHKNNVFFVDKRSVWTQRALDQHAAVLRPAPYRQPAMNRSDPCGMSTRIGDAKDHCDSPYRFVLVDVTSSSVDDLWADKLDINYWLMREDERLFRAVGARLRGSRSTQRGDQSGEHQGRLDDSNNGERQRESLDLGLYIYLLLALASVGLAVSGAFLWDHKRYRWLGRLFGIFGLCCICAVLWRIASVSTP